MSCFQRSLRLNGIFILLLCVLRIRVFGDKLEDSIYLRIDRYSQCVTLLNATHQIGCTSERKGNVGVVHYVDSVESFEWLLINGSHAPYIPLFTAELFTDDRLQQLIKADKVSGALVLHVVNKTSSATKRPSSGFSPEYRCPNEKFGLYSNDKTYSCSRSGSHSVSWNDQGSEMSYRNYDVPVFALNSRTEIDRLIQCYKDHNKPGKNGESPDYPFCGVELKSFMFAAKDTPTCMRKNSVPSFTGSTFCDELGDNNVLGTLFPRDKRETNTSVIMATAKLDSTAFFHEISFGADNDVSGIVVLLAAAEALGRLKRNGTIKSPNAQNTHIMFSFFQGEVWDYIGSSRMVYDMKNGKFPCEKCQLARMDLSNVAYYLELNQVGLLDDGKLWAHKDPASKDNVRSKTRKMFEKLVKNGASVKLNIGDPSPSYEQPLPPASFQRFLRENRSIPGLVITDHKASYTNKFYNSRFDDIINLKPESYKQLTLLATTVAKTLYQLAYNESLEDIIANETLVKEMLDCFLKNQTCSLFRNVLNENLSKQLAKKGSPTPMVRYVGPFNKRDGAHIVSTMTRFLLAYFIGTHKTNTTCVPINAPNFMQYTANPNKTCVTASVYLTPAQSPAFLPEVQDYDSTEYSTWTESRWGDIGIRMFLIADPVQEAITLAVGVVLTLISLLVTIFMYRKAEQLFTPGDSVLVINEDNASIGN